MSAKQITAQTENLEKRHYFWNSLLIYDHSIQLNIFRFSQESIRAAFCSFLLMSASVRFSHPESELSITCFSFSRIVSFFFFSKSAITSSLAKAFRISFWSHDHWPNASLFVFALTIKISSEHSRLRYLR